MFDGEDVDEKLEFLLKDENIQHAEIVDTVDFNGKETVGISLTVGMSESQIIDTINLVGEDLASKILSGFEILLTKSDLNKIIKLVRQF